MVKQTTTVDYAKLFGDLVAQLGELTSQRDGMNVEVAKLKQLVIATFAMLPEERQGVFQKEIDDLQAESAGLSEAIKLVFSAHKGKPLTPAQVRDYLTESGFDFRQYTANPVASITTTLKRMAPDYLITGATEAGQTTYMRRLTLLDQMGSGSGWSLAGAQLGYDGAAEWLPSAKEDPKRKTIGQMIGRRRTVAPPGIDDLPAGDPSHPIHSAGPIAKVSKTEDFKPKRGEHKLFGQERDGKK